jgi:hypothetical protein
VNDDNGTKLPGSSRDLPGDFSHPCETHFRKEVEVVLINGHDLRLLLFEQLPERLPWWFEHRVKDRDRDPVIA